MAVLTKGAIFAAAPATIEVQIPEWGGSVKVKGYSLLDRVALLDAENANQHDFAEYERDQALPEDERQGLSEVRRFDSIILEIIFSVVDEAGNRLFDLEDHDRIRSLGYASLTAIVAAIRQINVVPDQAALKKTFD